MPSEPRFVYIKAPYRWDHARQLLVYDGSSDPDPYWKWDAERGGYEPVDHEDMIFDRRHGVWVHAPKNVQ